MLRFREGPTLQRPRWWAGRDLNPRPSPCEGDVRSVQQDAYQAGLPAQRWWRWDATIFHLSKEMRIRTVYRISRTFVPCGFSSTRRANGMHLPPAFSIFTSALGENLNAATVNFSLGVPDPRTFPGTAMTSPGLACRDICPRFRAILVRRDLPRELATVNQMGAWCCLLARLR